MWRTADIETKVGLHPYPWTLFVELYTQGLSLWKKLL